VSWHIAPAAYDERLFAPLTSEGAGGDGAFLVRLRDDWISGAVRFDAPGEILLGAFGGDQLIAVGGISRDPYAPAPDLGRLRHIYVAKGWRGRGVARSLVGALVVAGRGRFARLRLTTGSDAAARLYEAFGFQPLPGPKQTHLLILAPPQPSSAVQAMVPRASR
jgi:GNAT superfamily N-acetyltransferase